MIRVIEICQNLKMTLALVVLVLASYSGATLSTHQETRYLKNLKTSDEENLIKNISQHHNIANMLSELHLKISEVLNY